MRILGFLIVSFLFSCDEKKIDEKKSKVEAVELLPVKGWPTEYDSVESSYCTTYRNLYNKFIAPDDTVICIGNTTFLLPEWTMRFSRDSTLRVIGIVKDTTRVFWFLYRKGRPAFYATETIVHDSVVYFNSVNPDLMVFQIDSIDNSVLNNLCNVPNEVYYTNPLNAHYSYSGRTMIYRLSVPIRNWTDEYFPADTILNAKGNIVSDLHYIRIGKTPMIPDPSADCAWSHLGIKDKW